MENFKIHTMMMMILYGASDQISFQSQRGTHTNISLCRNSTPSYERSARSTIECFTFCHILLANVCTSFNYHQEYKTCSIYGDVMHYDFNEYPNGSCSGFQITNIDCRSGFKFLMEGNKCVKMIISLWNWSDARDNCNALHPKSHPVILDDLNDSWLMSLYFKYNVYPNCQNPLRSHLNCYWTAGISYYVNNVRLPYTWIPFPGVKRKIKPSAPWDPNQPNALSDGRANCIQHFYEQGMADYFCSLKLCVLCEIDMN